MGERLLAAEGCPGKGEQLFQINPVHVIRLSETHVHMIMIGVPRMTTVHEEKVTNSDNSSDKVQNGESTGSQPSAPTTFPASRTCESLQELAAPKLPSGGREAPSGNSPSIVSSGYGSQAASSTNLSR